MDSAQKARIIEKLTGEKRRAMLPVASTLERTGFPRNGRIADIGCGVGYFTLPLAGQTNGEVVALDVSRDMLDILRERMAEAGITNIEPVLSDAYDLKIPDGSVDGALICNVLHEVDNPQKLLDEAARIVKSGGKLAVIEWRKAEQSMGPPVSERISVDEIVRMMEKAGFEAFTTFDVGEASCAVVGSRKIGAQGRMVHLVLQEMALYFGGDVRRINHALKVYGFAHAIGCMEGLDEGARKTLDCAALLHDIGIHEAERVHGSAAGHYQEIEGPPVARTLLLKCGADEQLIERVCFLAGHHHTYSAIDGVDFQILVEADFLVNIYEDNMDSAAIESVIKKYFVTRTGKKLAQSMYR